MEVFQQHQLNSSAQHSEVGGALVSQDPIALEMLRIKRKRLEIEQAKLQLEQAKFSANYATQEEVSVFVEAKKAELFNLVVGSSYVEKATLQCFKVLLEELQQAALKKELEQACKEFYANGVASYSTRATSELIKLEVRGDLAETLKCAKRWQTHAPSDAIKELCEKLDGLGNKYAADNKPESLEDCVIDLSHYSEAIAELFNPNKLDEFKKAVGK